MDFIKLHISIFLVAILIAACSNSNELTVTEIEQEHKQMTEKYPAAAKKLEENSSTNEFDGIVAKSETGISLHTGAGEFLIEGKDLSELVGKKVRITGAFEELDNAKKIHIATVTLLE